MGVAEMALLTAGNQFAQALSAYLGKISPLPGNIWAKAAVQVGKQIADNVAKATGMGLVAASAEFTTTNTAEKTFVASLATLPPIT